MFIESKIKPTPPKPTRTMGIGGTNYVFADANNDGHFIAQVHNREHAAALLAIPSAYCLYSASPKLTRGGPPPAKTADELAEEARVAEADAANKATAEQAEKDAVEKAAADAQLAADAALAAQLTDYTPEVIAEAKTLLAGDEKKLATATGSVSGRATIACALHIEQVAEKPRTKVVKVLGDALALLPAAAK